MSTVAVRNAVSASFDPGVDERSTFRITGWTIAISAATVLWGAIGVGVWSLVSLLG